MLGADARHGVVSPDLEEAIEALLGLQGRLHSRLRGTRAELAERVELERRRHVRRLATHCGHHGLRRALVTTVIERC